MSQGSIYRIHEKQLAAIRETVDAWKAAPGDSLAVGDLHELMYYCEQYPSILARLWSITFDRFRTPEIVDINELRDDALASFDQTLDLLRSIYDLAGQVRENGRLHERRERLSKVIDEVQRMKDENFAHWPRFEQKDIDEGLAEHARGECPDLDEAFAMIAGVDKETWLKRVQEYRQRSEK